MKIPGLLVAALLLTTPTAALAARGIATNDASMRAGPGAGFPVVDRIPGGARVDIHGCIRGDAWCDVSWAGDRGWVSADNLQYFYRSRYVYLPDYVDVIDVPIVPFVLSTYWANYYPGRPWYHRRAYWTNYWQSHARFATRLPNRGTRGLAGTETRDRRAGFANERGARGLATTETRGLGNERGARGPSERMTHANRPGAYATRGYERHAFGPRGATPGAREPLASPRGGTRLSAAPTNVPSARPNVGRVGGAPLQAHGQMMAAPRATGGVPNAGGGAARIGGGGAAHVGGGPAGGGGPRGGGPDHRH